MSGGDLVIFKLDAARSALAEAKTLQDTKQILDIAGAAETYAKRQKLGDEAIGYAHAIKVEALRRLGEMLKDSPRNEGAKGIGTSAVPKENRTPTLNDLGIDKKTSSIAQKMADLPADHFEQVKAGHVAVTKALRDAERIRRRADKIETLNTVTPLDGMPRYPVLYCDPPWRYEHVETESRAIENQYPTMALDEICALPVGGIAHDDSILFLWATSPKLHEAMRVLDSWGFVYRTCAVWDKELIGMGYYFRQQHELLLVATRGALPTPQPADRPSSVIRERRGKHSAKPDVVYDVIERMYPELRKVELFARRPRDGWASWGSEVAAAA